MERSKVDKLLLWKVLCIQIIGIFMLCLSFIWSYFVPKVQLIQWFIGIISFKHEIWILFQDCMPLSYTMGVIICPFGENINFGFFQFLESYWVENTQNLTRSQKITLRNSFGCLKIVSKVRAKPRFCHSFMYFTIKGR